MAANGLAGIVVLASVLLGGALSALLLFPLPPRPPRPPTVWDHLQGRWDGAGEVVETYGPALAMYAVLVGVASTSEGEAAETGCVNGADAGPDRCPEADGGFLP